MEKLKQAGIDDRRLIDGQRMAGAGDHIGLDTGHQSPGPFQRFCRIQDSLFIADQ